MPPITLQRLTAVDWRGLPEDRVTPLYQQEVERWSAMLDWDTTANWEEVERGRRLGTVPGIVVTDEHRGVVGWSYYVVRDRALQVGGFLASSESASQMMLDAIFADEVLEDVDAAGLFAFSDVSGLSAALKNRGLSVDRYWYLRRDIRRVMPSRLSYVRRWQREDRAAAAQLLAAAYPGVDEARPFAARARLDEWIEYVAQLTDGHGCGTILPDACVCMPGGPNRLLGLALVTRIAAGTAHIAQLAVDPQVQGRSFGSQLLEMACAAASQAGCDRMTLLVGARNSRARRLYEAAGFEAVTTFVSAGTLQPRRSTSVAPGRVVMARR